MCNRSKVIVLTNKQTHSGEGIHLTLLKGFLTHFCSNDQRHFSLLACLTAHTSVLLVLQLCQSKICIMWSAY